MKTFVRFLLCTLFLCVQSSQAYVISAALWRFNENAGADAGTEVLVLGDAHANDPIGKEHGEVLINKINEWAQYTEKTHFVLEGFPLGQEAKSIGYDKDDNHKILQNIAQKQDPDNRPLRMLSNYVNYDYDSNLSVQFNCADCRNHLIAFNNYLNAVNRMGDYINKLFFNMPLEDSNNLYYIHPDLNLKKLIEDLYTITLEKIQSLKKDCPLPKNSVEDMYIGELFRLIERPFVRTMDVLTTWSGEGLCVIDLQDRFMDLDKELSSFLHICGNLGFLLEFIKHKSEYKRHVIFVGAAHAATINDLMEKHKKEKKVEEILKVGPCDINDIFLKWPYEFKADCSEVPIETQKLINILNLAFAGVAKEDIGRLF